MCILLMKEFKALQGLASGQGCRLTSVAYERRVVESGDLLEG
jgi:hypothetical protein